MGRGNDSVHRKKKGRAGIKKKGGKKKFLLVSTREAAGGNIAPTKGDPKVKCLTPFWAYFTPYLGKGKFLEQRKALQTSCPKGQYTFRGEPAIGRKPVNKQVSKKGKMRDVEEGGKRRGEPLH